MSSFGYPFVFGPGWGNWASMQVAAEVPAPKVDAKVDEEAKTTRQTMVQPSHMIGEGLGGPVNGYAGYADTARGNVGLAARHHRPLASTYMNYRRMRNDGIVAIGRELADALVCVNEWSYEPTDDSDTAKEYADRLKTMWESPGALGSAHQGTPLRMFLLTESNRAKDYGNYNFEIVYGEYGDDETYTVVTDLPPLLPENTRPLIVQGMRTFAGLRNIGVNGAEIDLTPQYCLRLVFDAEGDLFGRSRFENCKEWIQIKWETRDKIRTDLNVSIGNIMTVKYPTSDSGTLQDTAINEQKAATIGISLSRGLTVTVPDFSMQQKLALARGGIDPTKLTAWDISRLQTGPNSFAGFDSALTTEDTQILYGLLTLPRSVRESKNSSRADSEQHTDSMGTMAWRWIVSVTGAAQLMSEECLEQWGGKSARKLVKIKPSPLDDATVALYKDFLIALVTGSPELGTKLADLTSMCEKLGIKILKTFDQEKYNIQVSAKNAGDTLSSGEKLRQIGFPDEKVKQIQGEKKTEDTVPTDEDGLGGGGSSGTRLSLSADDGGHWVTVDGVHVFIGEGGTIEKGPSHLIGKNPSEIGTQWSLANNSQEFDTTKHSAGDALAGIQVGKSYRIDGHPVLVLGIKKQTRVSTLGSDTDPSDTRIHGEKHETIVSVKTHSAGNPLATNKPFKFRESKMVRFDEPKKATA